MVGVNIDNANDEMREQIDELTTSANRFAVVFIAVFALLVLLASLFLREYVANIAHVVELVQALLLCSTALMGLTGLMMVETKKTSVPDLGSLDGFKKCRAINMLRDLAKAYAFLRWSLLLSILTILFCGSSLMIDNTALVASSIGAFAAQVYLFVWGLVFNDFLPS